MRFRKSELSFLVIEDQHVDQQLISFYINQNISNATIYIASTFAEAKEYLRSDTIIDVVLLDLGLPDMRGEQLVAEVLKYSNQATVIVLTAFSSQDFAISVLSMGVADYLIKEELNSSSLYKSIVYSIERKRIEKNLKESNERYEILAEATSDTIWDWDIENDRIQYSEGIYTMFGYKPESIINTSKWREGKIHPDDLSEVDTQLRNSFENKITNIYLEYRFLCADNT